MLDTKKPRKHKNVQEKRQLKAAELALFVKTSGRKAQKGKEPNDRKYDPEYAKKLRRMRPKDIEKILLDSEGDI